MTHITMTPTQHWTLCDEMRRACAALALRSEHHGRLDWSAYWLERAEWWKGRA